MSNNESTRTTWRTVDYIGGGFVLQVKMKATVEKTYNKSYQKRGEDFTGANVVGTEPCYECDVDIREYKSGNKGHIKSVDQPHRVVHMSELKGVNMGEVIQEIDERGGLK